METVQTFNPACQSLDEYLYPRPGKMNAKSVLKLLVLSFSENQHVRKITPKSFSSKGIQLCIALNKQSHDLYVRVMALDYALATYCDL